MSVEVKGREIPTYGVVRFIGKTLFNGDGYWVGVHLTLPLGKNNGSINGVRYFLCEENCGLFVRPQTVFPLNFAEFNSAPRKPAAIMDNDQPKNGNHIPQSVSKSAKPSVRSTICNLTKLKISLTMDLLHQQLECIERLENNSSRSPAEDEKFLKVLTQQEKDLWDKYSEQLSKLK